MIRPVIEASYDFSLSKQWTKPQSEDGLSPEKYKTNYIELCQIKSADVLSQHLSQNPLSDISTLIGEWNARHYQINSELSKATLANRVNYKLKIDQMFKETCRKNKKEPM